MELEKAQELQRFRAAHLAALAAFLIDNAPEAKTSATLAERYERLAARLSEVVQFYPPRFGEAYERTAPVRVATGAEPLPDIRLRFMRQPAFRGDVPSTIIAEWIHSPPDVLSIDDTNSVFADLAYGEVFAKEYADKTEVAAATEGDPLPPYTGGDPRSVAARMTLLEQSLAVLEAAQSGGVAPAGNPQ